MKKTILLVVAFAAQISFAQSIFPTDGGNVGIGTINPSQKLDVDGNAIFKGSIISSMSDYREGGHIQLINPSKISNGIANTWMIYNMASDFGNSIQFWAYDKLSCAGGGMCSNRFTIMDSGNVGIGTSNPISKLSIVGSLSIDGGLDNTSLRPLVSTGTLESGEIRGYSKSSNLADDGFLRISAGGGTSLVKSFIDLSGYSTIPNFDRNILFGTSGAERMRISYNGNVGIGTTNPDVKLAVNGTIHSKEVKVDMTGWSDFVFKKEYNLPTLEQVEKHIVEKGHLENIPNEEEVLKNGINLGEMNVKLLQKIEELTLYVIEQNKRLDKVEKENADLKNQINSSKK